MHRVFLSSLAFATAATTLSAEVQLVETWTTPAKLMTPESVLYDAQRERLYVSNIEDKQPWTKDGTGSIGVLALDGTILDASWVDGMEGPKGLGLFENTLYVADIDRIVLIDIAESKIAQTISIEGAKMLNDITVTTDGTAYISDSGTGRIHRLKKGDVSVFRDDFESPNGVLAVDGGLYVLDAETLFLIDAAGTRKTVVEGIVGHVDGVEKVGPDAFVISCWNGVVYYAKAGEAPKLLLDFTEQEGFNSADIGYHPDTQTIYVPTFFADSVIAYELKQ